MDDIARQFKRKRKQPKKQRGSSFKLAITTGVIILFAALFYIWSTFGDTTIGLTLTTNPDLERGLVGHWTFDGEHVESQTGAFDVSTASFVDSFSVAAQEINPTDVTFNTDGTKMFVVGNVGDDINEYILTTAFDVSTASFVDSFSVVAQETFPTGIAFSSDGTKMFVVGASGDDVNEYTLTTAFDVSTAAFVDSFSVAAQEASPSGVTFSNDGTTMFVVGFQRRRVNEYTLTTGFDVSTASFVDSFSVIVQENLPRGLAFSTDGTTMFVVGSSGDSVYEYTLTTGFDVSTASFVDSFSVNAQDRTPTGITFSNDGTTMFVVGAADGVYEYVLSTSLTAEDRSISGNDGAGKGGATPAIGRLGQALKFDGIDDYIDVGAVSSGVRTIAFWMKAATSTTNMNIIAIDGTDRIELDGSGNVVASGFPSATVYVDGSSASAHVADTGWHHVVITDTTGVNASNFDIGRVEGTGSFGGSLDDVRLYDRVLSADEIKRLYGLGATTKINRTLTANPELEDGLVGHWTFDGPDMISNVADSSGQGNTGYLTNFAATTTKGGRLGQALQLDGVDDYVSIPHISTPDELTYAFWIHVSSSDTQNVLLSMKTLVRISGGDQVQYFPDIDTTVVTASGFSLLDEWRHIVVTHDSSNNYVVYVDGVSELSGTTVDIDSGVVAGLGSRLGGYNSPGFVDGTIDDVRIYNRALSEDDVERLYGLGATTRINRTITNNPELKDSLVGHWTFDGPHVTRSTFDVSTASFVDSFSVSAQETIPVGIAFNTDGTTMFVVGNSGNDVNEYILTTAFDVSTASFVDSFSVAAQDTSPTGLAFSTDGTTMFVVGNSGNDVNEYTLTTAFDVSTASFVDSFSVNAQETTPMGLAFSSDGTTMFVVGSQRRRVNEYTLSTGFDVSTASFVDSFWVGTQESVPTGLAFSTDGTTMFVVGDHGNDVNEYILTTAFDVSTASFVDSFSVNAQDRTPTGLAFSSDGTKMFVVGNSGNDVNEYVLSTSLTAEDRSTSGNDGVGKGGVTPAMGRLGQALKFDGIDDYIDVGAVSGGVRTIAFWMKVATSTTNMNIIDINGIDWIELDGSSHVVASSFPSATVYVDGSSASAHIADTGWHHVVITDTTGVNASDFDIGRVEGAGLFGGRLDDVRLYDRVLSADEIKRLYELGR